jgi:hypothetical protein
MELSETVWFYFIDLFFLLACMVVNLLIDWMYDLQCPLKDEIICFVLERMGTKIKLHMQYLGPENNGSGRYF